MDAIDFASDDLLDLLWAGLAWLVLLAAAIAYAARASRDQAGWWPRVLLVVAVAAIAPGYGALQVLQQRQQRGDAEAREAEEQRHARRLEDFCRRHPPEVVVKAAFHTDRPVALQVRRDPGAWQVPLLDVLPPPWLAEGQQVVARLQWEARSPGGACATAAAGADCVRRWQYDPATRGRSQVAVLDGPVVLSVTTIFTPEPLIRQYRLALATAVGQELGATTIAGRTSSAAQQPFCAPPDAAFADLLARVLVLDPATGGQRLVAAPAGSRVAQGRP